MLTKAEPYMNGNSHWMIWIYTSNHLRNVWRNMRPKWGSYSNLENKFLRSKLPSLPLASKWVLRAILHLWTMSWISYAMQRNHVGWLRMRSYILFCRRHLRESIGNVHLKDMGQDRLIQWQSRRCRRSCC